MDYTFAEYSRDRLAAQGEESGFEQRLALSAMGLAGESGEFSEIVKKYLFHGRELDREHAIKELGDILWYIMFAADTIGSSLDEVARANDAKLRERYPNGFTVEAASKRK